jgi:hypothetical protein
VLKASGDQATSQETYRAALELYRAKGVEPGIRRVATALDGAA